jgi:hypothetical protein
LYVTDPTIEVNKDLQLKKDLENVKKSGLRNKVETNDKNKGKEIDNKAPYLNIKEKRDMLTKEIIDFSRNKDSEIFYIKPGESSKNPSALYQYVHENEPWSTGYRKTQYKEITTYTKIPYSLEKGISENKKTTSILGYPKRPHKQVRFTDNLAVIKEIPAISELLKQRRSNQELINNTGQLDLKRRIHKVRRNIQRFESAGSTKENPIVIQKDNNSVIRSNSTMSYINEERTINPAYLTSNNLD